MLLSYKPRRALLPTVSWGASLSPLKKRLKASLRVRAPKAAGGAAFTITGAARAGARGVRASARIQPRWPLAAAVPALLLTTALAGCDQKPQPQPQPQQQQQPAAQGQKDAPRYTYITIGGDGEAQPPQQGSAASAPQKAAQPASSPEPWKPSTPDETAVQQRAKERWDALVVRDFDRAWNYLEPAEREKVKQEDYKNRFGTAGKLEGADVYRVVCGKTRCAARIRLASKIPAPGAAGVSSATTYFDEEWRKEGGQWWYRGTAGAHKSEQGEEPLPSAADPLPPAAQPASGPAWGGAKPAAVAP